MYDIRPPQSKMEWDAVKERLIAYREEFGNSDCFTTFEEELTDIEQYYAGLDKIKLVAVSIAEGKVVGCVALRTFSPGVAEMKRLYVVPSHRGHHLGRQLAEAIIEKAIENGYTKMILDTMTAMKAAQSLYQQLGFYVVPAYHQQDPQNVICFEKIITIH